MKRILVTTLAALALGFSSPAIAGAHGNFYGHVKAEIEPPPADCPVSIESAGIQDNESQSKAAMAFLGPVGGRPADGANHAYSVRYDLHLRAERKGVSAVEVEWIGTNAFGEVQGSRKASVSWKHPLDASQGKYESETADRLPGDVAKYKVHVSRVAFEDGTVWTAPEPTPAPSSK